MTRVMYQNVNNFGHARFFTDSTAKPPGIGGKTMAGAAEDRLGVLIGVVTAANPDLLSIVEVVPGSAWIAEGHLNWDASAANLLDAMNGLGLVHPTTGAARAYRLVPPLVTGIGGKAESVAVFYDMNELQFLGPWAWPGGTGPAATAASITGGGRALAGYPANWTNAANPALNVLPHRQLPATSPYNPNAWEDTLAGQWSFENPVGTALDFPTAAHRKPFLTVFAELNAPRRIIKLLSFHAPPNQIAYALGTLPLSVDGTAALARVREVTTALEADEVACIVGDFNVSLFSTGGTDPAGQAYTPITGLAPAGAAFTGALSRGAPPLPDQFPDKSYLITHIQTSTAATPWNTNGYPGFGYVSVPDVIGRYDAIDNAFTRFGGAAAGGPATQVTILNPVIGAPYNAAAAPAGAPTGTLVVGSQMNNPAILPVPGGWALNTPGKLKSFQGWNNYRKVQSSSDHMALALDL